MPEYKYKATERDYSIPMEEGDDAPMIKPTIMIPVSKEQIKEAMVGEMVEIKIMGEVVGMESRKGRESKLTVMLEMSDVYGDSEQSTIRDMMEDS